MSAAPSPAPAAAFALELRDLDVAYTVRGVDRQVLRDLSLRIEPGESYGLVGESGCGKSTAALTALRYLPRNGRVRSGQALVGGSDVWQLSSGDLRELRAREVGAVYQNPGAALNPSLRIGLQVAEAFTVLGHSRSEADALAEDALRRVQIADPGSVVNRYPHQLSGGMQQRVVIAMALSKNPSFLVLDEPTTGLDATVEAEVLDLIEELKAESSTAVLFISHNLGVIARMCTRVGVLYAGRLVEEGDTGRVLGDPRHPYTVGLMRCVPRRGLRKQMGRLDTIPGFLPDLGAELPGCVFVDRCALAKEVCRAQEPALEVTGTPGHVSRCHFHERAQQLPRVEDGPITEMPEPDRGTEPLLHLDGVHKVFRQRGGDVPALTDVSLSVWPGETLGLVGESGSGKTTLAKVVLGMLEPTSGSVSLSGRALPASVGDRSQEQARALQMVFQNPGQALNRRHSVQRILYRTLKKLAGLTGRSADARLARLTEEVRLPPRYLPAKPSQLSGGLQQRVAIARAFAGSPQLVACDEPTSALDVSVQAAILNLLADLQVEEGVAYLFISHDLGVVRYLSDRIAVLYLGRLLEIGPAEAVFAGPHHPYTEALLSAVPSIDGEERRRIALQGEIPSAASPPSGCVFHTRCPRKLGTVCEDVEPQLVEEGPGHLLRCHIPLEELRTSRLVPGAEGPA